MKCLFFFLNFSALYASVACLSLVLQPDTIAGRGSMVLWTRGPTDVVGVRFDLRFVQGLADVGLAAANIEATDDFGTVSVIFPSAGSYVLKAVSG
ncbi:hypothetical protein B0H34DRAFT_283689 [Crassisporium funariophilum]|nr:hypothetical protein B0H34DRAFT_283689 [Crassisporium funariophilum]